MCPVSFMVGWAREDVRIGASSGVSEGVYSASDCVCSVLGRFDGSCSSSLIVSMECSLLVLIVYCFHSFNCCKPIKVQISVSIQCPA